MITHGQVLDLLEHFEKAVLGESLWSACTHNQGAHIRPQCVDGIELWATKQLGAGCISTGGNNARGLFDNADPAVWDRIRNSRSFVAQPGDILVYAHRATGHTDIALPGCTRRNIVGLDQNWSWKNHFTKENHPYGELIGALRFRGIGETQIHVYHEPEVHDRLGQHVGTYGFSARAIAAAKHVLLSHRGVTIRKERRGPVKVYVVRYLTDGDMGSSHGTFELDPGLERARRLVNAEGFAAIRLEP